MNDDIIPTFSFLSSIVFVDFTRISEVIVKKIENILFLNLNMNLSISILTVSFNFKT